MGSWPYPPHGFRVFSEESLLSFNAPRNFLFQDPETGEYGILESYEAHEHENDQDDAP